MLQTISLSQSNIALTKDDTVLGSSIVVFIPGISGGAASSRFAPLVDVCLSAGYPIACVDMWKSEAEVLEKTPTQLLDALSEVFEYLQSLGYTDCIAVGKSLGAGLLLIHHHAMIRKKILWSPAVSVGDIDTFSQYADVKYADIHELMSLNREHIENDQAEVCIIHGTADTIVPISNSRNIIQMTKDGKLVEIENATHSFKTPEEEESLMLATRTFLVG